jgi:D-alanine-D-alanine ligase
MAMMWRTARRTYTVAVLAGGDSHERAVSLASGAQVVPALEAAGHRAELFDPAEIDLVDIPWSRFDVCFIALHGGAGEDGRIQQQLERLKVPYTGSGPVASHLAMSKSSAKERFFLSRVPTLAYLLFQANDPIEDVVAGVSHLGFPLVIKPDSQGSSLGVGFAESADELAQCVAESSRYDSYLLAERWIDGREFTMAVLGRRLLPRLEIATPRGLFDYNAKYHSGTTEYRFDTGLDFSTISRIEDAALGAATALGATGLVRVDVMLDRHQQPWVLEVNTSPGLTASSMAPKAAAEAGLSLDQLCDWMLLDALKLEVTP